MAKIKISYKKGGPSQIPALREALNQLNPVDRDVFLMREAGGLSYGEISFACQLTPDAVRSRLHRARQQLRGALQATGDRSDPSWR